MTTLLDLILPPIIVGILILSILSLNTRMMESQIDTRLTSEMQQFANAALSAIQEEVRNVDDLISLSEAEFRYKSTSGDSVKIFREGRNLKVEKMAASTGVSTTKTYPARLSKIAFDIVELGSEGPFLLRVLVECESASNEKVSTTNWRQRAYAQRDFYLRNIE